MVNILEESFRKATSGSVFAIESVLYINFSRTNQIIPGESVPVHYTNSQHVPIWQSYRKFKHGPEEGVEVTVNGLVLGSLLHISNAHH